MKYCKILFVGICSLSLGIYYASGADIRFDKSDIIIEIKSGLYPIRSSRRQKNKFRIGKSFYYRNEHKVSKDGCLMKKFEVFFLDSLEQPIQLAPLSALSLKKELDVKKIEIKIKPNGSTVEGWYSLFTRVTYECGGDIYLHSFPREMVSLFR